MPGWGLIGKDRCIYCGTTEAEDFLLRQTPNNPKKDHICLACVVERGLKELERKPKAIEKEG